MMKPTIRTDYHAVFSRSKSTSSFSIQSLFKPAIVFALGFSLGIAYHVNVSKPNSEMVAAAVIDMKGNGQSVDSSAKV
jgi:hypothetical protein